MTSDKIKDGGPAFPSTQPTETWVTGQHGQAVPVVERHGGMTLRDWFAGQALAAAFPAIMGMAPSDLPGLAAKLGLDGSATPYDLVAVASLKAADAMLKAREAQP